MRHGSLFSGLPYGWLDVPGVSHVQQLEDVM